MPPVPGAAGRAGGGAAPPRGALPARLAAVPRQLLRALLRAPQLRAQPHEDQAPPAVGKNEDVEVELWMGHVETVFAFGYRQSTAVKRNTDGLATRPRNFDLQDAFFKKLSRSRNIV